MSQLSLFVHSFTLYIDTFEFFHFLYSPQFVLQQAGFMTSVQGLLGKLGPKKGGGKKVSTIQ